MAEEFKRDRGRLDDGRKFEKFQYKKKEKKKWWDPKDKWKEARHNKRKFLEEDET